MEYFRLWPDGPLMEQSGDAAPIGTDSILLSSFATVTGVRRAIDLGCGCGVIALTLLSRSDTVRVDAVDILPGAAELARRNAELNGLSGRMRVRNMDLRRLSRLETGCTYDLIVSNPPYFPVDAGGVSGNVVRLASRSETFCTLEDLISCADRLSHYLTKFAFIHRTERLPEILVLLNEHRLTPKRLRFMQTRLSSPPSLFMIECKKGAKPGLTVEPVLILQNDDGTETDEVKRIYRRG